MRPFLLGVTPHLHEDGAGKLRGSLNRATVLIATLILIPTILWLLHAVGTIPSYFPRQLPPQVISAIGGISGSIDGANGFMIDPGHFLTTERALKGDGGTAALEESASVSFLDANGSEPQLAEGKVAWISDAVGGTRLVMLQMNDERVDFLVPGTAELTDGSRLLIAGQQLDSTDGVTKLTQGSFSLTLFEDEHSLGNADWGEGNEPTYEGAPVILKNENDEYIVIGILTQGSYIIKLPVESLRQAGANF